MTKREPDHGNMEVWSTVIERQDEGHRYSSSGGNAERTYYMAFTEPPQYWTFHQRGTKLVKVRVTRQATIDRINYNVTAEQRRQDFDIRR